MSGKIPVGILAATGSVGQRFVQHLVDHPWFEIAAVTGSPRTIGRPYGEGVNWIVEGDPPPAVAEMIVEATDTNLAPKVLFSALPTAEAREIEPKLAAAGYIVLTNASPFRMDPYVPLLIPEVNADHTAMIPQQQKEYGWDGYIVANANCSTTSIVLPLQILHVVNAKSEMADVVVSAHSNRLPVINGHIGSMSVKLKNPASAEDAIALFKNWQPNEVVQQLPSMPESVLIYRPEADRPQPRKDRMSGNGLSWTLGRVRECPVNDVRFLSLTHNTLRGAASGSVLNAELLKLQGYL